MSLESVPGARPADGRAWPVDHLRATITVLVVLHHAVLAYNPYAPATFDWSAKFWRAFPVIDTAKWPGSELIVLFNDSFFMALMFFIGGLFVVRSLAARGVGGYLRERALRLGVPFVIGAAVLAPIAYYPAYLQAGGTGGVAGYAQAWTSLGVWPSGPVWFLWVLFALGVAFALAHRFARGAVERAIAALRPLATRPARAFAVFATLAVLVYVPATFVVDGLHWSEWGPFTVQTARVPLYALYFVVGAGLGSAGDALFARDGAFARRWWIWQIVAPIVFIAFVAVLITLFVTLEKHPPGIALLASTAILYAVTGVATSIAFVSFYARFAHVGGPALRSLDRNAYGIFLLHYAFVSWAQYGLLGAPWPGVAKALVTFAGALALSWATTAALRRLPGVARVI